MEDGRWKFSSIAFIILEEDGNWMLEVLPVLRLLFQREDGRWVLEVLPVLRLLFL